MLKTSGNKKITAVSLFSGCGGMDLGAHNAGIKVIWANELVPTYCDTLKKNFPDTKIVQGNIADINTFPKADLVFGGYPCQSFSMGGKRNPEKDERTYLYKEFARVLNEIQPKYFIAENVSGLKKVKRGKFLNDQLALFESAGKGYRVSYQVLDAKDYGVPQTRKRILLIGVRKDLNKYFEFPKPTHGKATKKNPYLLPYSSHGEAIKDLPLDCVGEFYERPDNKGNFSWYFMSRNRKANWDGPAFTVVANWRHVTLHPACPTMKLTWSDLANGWKQKWDFSNEYEHLKTNKKRPVLKKPRRLSWRECARIQTFPDHFKFQGRVEDKYAQIGNAVPPVLFEKIVKEIVSGSGLKDVEEMKNIGIVEQRLSL
ncbi:MAG: DNA cytosine methyltransferase [Candidatus Yanofskybacteria bacterium]|nr:DNA cytosine methyltransferase [Candidatus Yanofskybacteria bacterium]